MVKTLQFIAVTLEQISNQQQRNLCSWFLKWQTVFNEVVNQKTEWFKSFAIMIAQLSYENERQCNNPQSPVSLIIFNGMKDHIIPYNGGEAMLKGMSYGHIYSAEESVQHWLTASNPPLHLIVGPDAYERGTEYYCSQLTDIEKRKEQNFSTNFE